MEYVDMNHLRFLLFDVSKLQEILAYERYKEFDASSVAILLDAIKDLADTELFPFFRIFDKEPAVMKDGQIWVHPQIGRLIRLFGENGWIGSHFPPEHGGLNMPHLLEATASHIFLSANNHMPGYTALTTGAANLITAFGRPDQIDRYVPGMVSGKWMGTMCLTEPEAGSSVGDLRTEAIAQPGADHYLIKGQKIFISGGDHPYADNFIHLVLARVQGAPSGTKGISLFIVPKFREDEGGSIFNDVLTVGDYQKLGQRGYSTVHLMFGENDNCRGWLLGEENEGLKYMFRMMNHARLDVGMIAASIATAAYQASLQYARERTQGRRLSASGIKEPEQCPIIDHPDVRRMLMFQKAVSEGAVALLFETYGYLDRVKNTTGEEKHRNQLILDLLTPVAKSFPADIGIHSVSQGIQVLGGYGYIEDYPLEQYFRDIRITSLYEGTSGIQAMDLLGRKATAENGQALMILLEVLNETIGRARMQEDLKANADRLEEAIAEIQKILACLLPFAFQKDYERFLADASLFLEATGLLLVAWQWLKMAVVAGEKLAQEEKSFDPDFYAAKIHTMKFYFTYELPKLWALSESLQSSGTLTIKTEKEFVF